MQLNPNISDVYRNLGLAFYEKQDFDKAITYYDKALKLSPGSIDVYNNLGALFQEKGDYREAMVWYQKALELDPDNAVACNNLGNALSQCGRDSEAIGYFRKAILLNPDYVEAHAIMSHVLLSPGNFQEGWEEYEWCLFKKESRSAFFPQPVWEGSSFQKKPFWFMLNRVSAMKSCLLPVFRM